MDVKALEIPDACFDLIIDKTSLTLAVYKDNIILSQLW